MIFGLVAVAAGVAVWLLGLRHALKRRQDHESPDHSRWDHQPRCACPGCKGARALLVEGILYPTFPISALQGVS